MRQPAPTTKPTLDAEQKFWSRNIVVAGIDEVGRGALAGPVVAAAVVLHPSRIPDGIDDSKPLWGREHLQNLDPSHGLGPGKVRISPVESFRPGQARWQDARAPRER